MVNLIISISFLCFLPAVSWWSSTFSVKSSNPWCIPVYHKLFHISSTNQLSKSTFNKINFYSFKPQHEFQASFHKLLHTAYVPIIHTNTIIITNHYIYHLIYLMSNTRLWFGGKLLIIPLLWTLRSGPDVQRPILTPFHSFKQPSTPLKISNNHRFYDSFHLSDPNSHFLTALAAECKARSAADPSSVCISLLNILWRVTPSSTSSSSTLFSSY